MSQATETVNGKRKTTHYQQTPLVGIERDHFKVLSLEKKGG